MIPQRFEYIFILALYAATGLSVTSEGLRRAINKTSTRTAAVVFLTYCFTIEIVALHLGWWTFAEERVIGVYLWRIPLEECLLFFVFFAIVIGAWEVLNDGRL